MAFNARYLSNPGEYAAKITSIMHGYQENVVIVGITFGLTILGLIYLFFLQYPYVPSIKVPLTPEEANTNPRLRPNEPIPKDVKMDLLDPKRPGKVQCFDPSTMEKIGEVIDMTPSMVEEIVLKAKVAQKDWVKTSFEERRMVMRILLKFFVEEAESICRVSIRDSGKTELCAMLGEIIPTVEKLRWIIAYGESILSPSKRGGSGLLTLNKSARVEYIPLGVIGVGAPWNYPCHNMLNHIISGLFAGNAVVVKVSEFTSWSADYYLRIVRAALKEAGDFPPDLVHVVTGFADAGAALAASKNIDKFVFTGSDRVGRLVMKGCASNLTGCVLELGGKDPFILCKDVNIDNVIAAVTRGTFQNSGQNCVGIERIYVERPIYEEFVKRMVKIVSNLRQGIPLEGHGDIDVGAMVMPGQIEIIQQLVDDAVNRGAKLLVGGARNEALSPGIFYQPTILVDVTPDMRISKEEVFGPVMVIMAFDNDDEVLARVNDCVFGLGSSVFCYDRTRALKLMRGIKAGMCNINDFGVNYLVQSLPFGGVKHSGFGRFGGPEGLRALCYEKSITEDISYYAQASIPVPFMYPTATNAPTLAKSLVDLGYGWGYIAKLRGLLNLVKGLVFAKWAVNAKRD